MKNIKFDFNDFSLVPARLSSISSRSEIDLFYPDMKLPLFIAPMDTVVDDNNYNLFRKMGFNVCIPRKKEIYFDNNYEDDCFISFGLDDIEKIINEKKILPKKVLIDVANAHSIRVYNISKKIKKEYDVVLMVGNIANPLTYQEYCEIGVDYVRCGIGAGHVCTTSANSSIHYPMASLISECFDIKEKNNFETKIVADGGFKNYDDIIKALSIGSDYVMLGNVINKSIESAGQNYINNNGEFLEITKTEALQFFKEKIDVYKSYRGMSTKSVQISLGKTKLKTSEGIEKYNLVEYSIYSWTENFMDYLKSCMSYQDKKTITSFVGSGEYVFITQNSFNRFHK